MVEKKFTWVDVLYGVLLFAVGLMILILAIINQVGTIDMILSYAIAVVLFILGIVCVVTSIVIKNSELVNATIAGGCIAIAFGILLCVLPDLITALLIVFIAAFLLAVSFVSFIKIFVAAAHKEKASQIVTYAVAFVLCAVIGALAIGFRVQFTQIILGCLGALMMVGAIGGVVVAIKASSAAKKANKAVEQPKE